VKILWHSVAPWAPSGYGQQTALFAPPIKALGHDLVISAYYGLQGADLDWHGIKCLPSYSKMYGADTIVPHALWHFGAGGDDVTKLRDAANRGLVITLTDVWVLDAPLLPDLAVAAWAPIDHETVPPAVQHWFGQTGAIPIAMSRFGERAMREIGLEPIYVPHGVDTSVFFPGDKAEARARIGLPEDAFVVAIVAANVGKDGARKAFAEQITAFAELRRRHSDAVLVLHTDIDAGVGVRIRDLIDDLPEGSCVYTDQYMFKRGLPASKVADIYRAADVYSNTSWGEGFGICIIEAQACGTPVIVTDTTAMPELAGAGWKVPGEPLWHDSQRAWARRPLLAGIIDAYEKAYDGARDEDLRAQAWAFAQAYDVANVMAEYWEPALKTLETALDRRRDDALTTPKAATLETTLRQADGLLWLDRGNRTDDWIGWSKHEETLGPILDGLLPDGGVFLDVGAHIGRWSLRLAGKASWVYAVEPNPETGKSLVKHLVLNEIKNVSRIPVAAWDVHAQLRLDDANNRLAGGSTRTLEVAEAEATDPVSSEAWVPARPLDDVLELQAADRIDLIKMDVEGADLHALRGMAGLIAKHRPAMVVECHDQYGYYTRAELEAVLTDLGYVWDEVKYLTSPYLVCTPAPE
jgi:FkbM family methyltransferase